MIDLSGKRALVTGASRGIGRACALRLAECGADVAVNFLTSKGPTTEVVRDIQGMGRRCIAVRADVSDRDDVAAMVETVIERFGGLDIIVSNVAAGGFRNAAELTPVTLEATLRTNAAAVVWLAQSAADALSASDYHGKVVAISSHGSMWAVPNYAAIGASKAALESLIRHLAMDFGPRGINFNCVLPGIVATDAVLSMPGVEDLIQAAQGRMMVGDRRLKPEDIASTVAFLSSSLSDLIQGQTIVIDGGVSIRV